MPVDVEHLKQAHPIADVIRAHGVELRRSGRRYIGRCPFHSDDRPSFVVYPDTRSYHCFGCRSGGDVLDFIRQARDLGFKEAATYLGELAPAEGTIPARPTSPSKPRRLTVDDRLILTAACEIYQETLWRTPHALSYLEQRGIPEWLIRRERLGYSDGETLQAYLRRRRLSIPRAIEMGLLYPDRRGRGEREALRGRIVFPDLRAGYCGWMTGRSLAPDAKAPYLSLALPRPLFGYESIRGHERALVTEGPLDRLTLLAWELPACATLGTQISAFVLRLLKRIRFPVLVLDGDDAGRAATAWLRGELGEGAAAVSLPIKDVNRLGQEPDGRETFLQLLEEAERTVRGVAPAR